MVTYREEGATTLWVSIFFFFFFLDFWVAYIITMYIWGAVFFVGGLDKPTQKRSQVDGWSTTRRWETNCRSIPRAKNDLLLMLMLVLIFLALQFAHNDPVFFSILVWASPISMAQKCNPIWWSSFAQNNLLSLCLLWVNV